MFVEGDKVVLRNVKLQHGRDEEDVKVLQDIQKDGIVGEIIMIDKTDKELTYYVGFLDLAYWLNVEELELYKMDIPLEEEKKFDLGVNSEPKKENKSRNDDDVLKARMFDFLVKNNKIDYNRVLKEYEKDNMLEDYVDSLIQFHLEDLDILSRISIEELKKIIYAVLIEVEYEHEIKIFED